MSMKYREELASLFDALSSPSRIGPLAYLSKSEGYASLQDIHSATNPSLNKNSTFKSLNILVQNLLAETDDQGKYRITKLGKCVISEIDKLAPNLGESIRRISKLREKLEKKLHEELESM